MKIQLDFTRKEIVLESNVNLKEFFDQIKTLLPDWKDWKLSANNTIYWSNPIPWTWYEPFNPFWNKPIDIYTTCHAAGGTTDFEMHQTITTNKSSTNLQSTTKPQNIYCLEIN